MTCDKGDYQYTRQSSDHPPTLAVVSSWSSAWAAARGSCLCLASFFGASIRCHEALMMISREDYIKHGLCSQHCRPPAGTGGLSAEYPYNGIKV